MTTTSTTTTSETTTGAVVTGDTVGGPEVFRQAAARIAAGLVADAFWDEDRATWLGDDVEPLPGGGRTVVYRAVGGDLYGGTAGIAVFLARWAAASGHADARTAALGAVRHAARWVERTRPDGSLLSGAGGVALAALEVARLVDSREAAALALPAARATVLRPPREWDLVVGSAGHLLALLELERALVGLDDVLAARAGAAADDAAARLVAGAVPGPVVGVAWPSDVGQPPLCGLAHGASGGALALAEWSIVRGRPDTLVVAAGAAAYERAWFSAEQGSWADLRGLDERAHRHGATPTYPDLWCHGSLGVGVARLRLHEITGEPVYAAEAGVAVDAAVSAFDALGRPGAVLDLSVCHGLGGAADLLLDAAATFGQPVLAEVARDGIALALEAVGDGPWPCGVPDGGEAPGLFVGTAGIGALLLRLTDDTVPATTRAYAGRTMAARVVVKLAGPLDADLVAQRVAQVRSAAPGAHVDRVSGTGRVLLRLPVDADPDAVARALGSLDAVEWAEVDVVDTVAPIRPDSSTGS